MALAKHYVPSTKQQTLQTGKLVIFVIPGLSLEGPNLNFSNSEDYMSTRLNPYRK